MWIIIILAMTELATPEQTLVGVKTLMKARFSCELGWNSENNRPYVKFGIGLFCFYATKGENYGKEIDNGNNRKFVQN